MEHSGVSSRPQHPVEERDPGQGLDVLQVDPFTSTSRQDQRGDVPLSAGPDLPLAGGQRDVLRPVGGREASLPGGHCDCNGSAEEEKLQEEKERHHHNKVLRSRGHILRITHTHIRV